MTSLEHKRQEFTIDGLIGTLDVEEKARTKDIRGKGVVGASSANHTWERSCWCFKCQSCSEEQLPQE